MKDLINKIMAGTTLIINNVEYIVKTKTWYTIEEDDTVRYAKCELSNDKVLVIIPDDNLTYLGQVIENMNYERISKEIITYNGITFTKTGEGHQAITEIEFGKEEAVEGKCIFEDYEADNNIISLGILPDKNKRADVYADILNINDIKFKA